MNQNPHTAAFNKNQAVRHKVRTRFESSAVNIGPSGLKRGRSPVTRKVYANMLRHHRKASR